MTPLARPPAMHVEDGEALFSFLGRWLHRTGAPDAQEFLCAVTGGPRRALSLMLPCRLAALRSFHEALNGMSVEAMVSRFSCASMYRPFLSEDTWSEVVAHLGANGTRQVRMMLGMAHARSEHPLPKHCPACMAEQLQSHGHIFWPLHFSMPFVRACHRHGLQLLPPATSSVIRLGRSSYLGFPSTLTMKSTPSSRATDADVRLSSLAICLADANIGALCPTIVANAYHTGICRKGLSDSSGRVRRLDLWRCLLEEWRGLPNLDFGPGRQTPAWLDQLYARSGCTVRSPLFHLLLIGLLFGDIASWRDAIAESHLDRGRLHDTNQFAESLSHAMGTKHVQLQRWLNAHRGNGAPLLLPTDVVAHLECGLPVRAISDACGISRFRIYRALKRLPGLARVWALTALENESSRRRGSIDQILSSTDTKTDDVQRANKKWVYRHNSALKILAIANASSHTHAN